MQAALALSFTVFVLLSAGVAGYLSQRSGREAVQAIAVRLRGDMATHIGGHVRDFLHIPHVINRLNADALSAGMPNALDERALELHFRKQIDVFSSVSSIYFGNTREVWSTAAGKPPSTPATLSKRPVDARASSGSTR